VVVSADAHAAATHDENNDYQPRPTILIACTADTTATRPLLEQYGIADVLVKPVTVQAMRHMLHKWLPRDASPPGEALVTHQGPVRRSRSGNVNERILLVEDCEVTLLATELLLQQQGLVLDTATSGEEAMEALSKRDYDLLLVDVQLPGVSGYALCSWYKEMCSESARACGRVVAVTADPDEQTCKEFGIDLCLPKPLSTHTIVQLLRDHWSDSGA